MVLAALLSVVSTGCQSPSKLGSNRVAAVVIKNASPEHIKDAVKIVLEREGFEAAPQDENELIFQKKASFGSSFMYGDWYGGAVWERLKLYLRDLKPDETLLDCDVFMVQEPDDPLFEKVRKVKARKSECQRLLDEISCEAAHKT